MATALMAIARKVIILDVKELEPAYLGGLAAVALAMSVGYWLVVVAPERMLRAAKVPASGSSGDGYRELVGAGGHEPPAPASPPR
jgi:hypothetical protein